LVFLPKHKKNTARKKSGNLKIPGSKNNKNRPFLCEKGGFLKILPSIKE